MTIKLYFPATESLNTEWGEWKILPSVYTTPEEAIKKAKQEALYLSLKWRKNFQYGLFDSKKGQVKPLRVIVWQEDCPVDIEKDPPV